MTLKEMRFDCKCRGSFDWGKHRKRARAIRKLSQISQAEGKAGNVHAGRKQLVKTVQSINHVGKYTWN